MCRLFAQISPTPRTAWTHLVESNLSLLRQSSADRKNLQKDGWGIAYFAAGGKAVVRKSAKPAFREKRLFRAAAARTGSKFVLGHIRAASNPRGLSLKRLISRANAQPYTDGRWIFAHNGTLEIPDEVAAALGPWRRRIKSSNDSEVYFWQFLKFWSKTKNAAAAFESCVRENWRLWRKCRSRHPEKKGPYTSLNAIATDGKSLHAFCHSLRPGRKHGVLNPRQPWTVMSFARRGDCILIGSENLDRGRWTLFRPPELLSVAVTAKGSLSIRRRPAHLPSLESINQ